MEKIWYKSYSSDMPKTIDADAYTSLTDIFEKFSNKYADIPAFTNFDVTITYQQLNELSAQLAAYLQHTLGLKKGDRVAIMMPNVLQYPVTVFGVLRAGCAVVNVNPLYTARELKYQLNDSGSTVVIVLANFAHTVAKIIKETSVQHVIVTEIGDLLGFLKGTLVNFVVKRIKHMVPEWIIPNALSFKMVMQAGAKLKLQPVNLHGEDLAFLQYTGGTTGVAKGAVLTHRNMVANVLQCAATVCMDVKPGEEIVVGALPFYHIFALTVCCLLFLVFGAECLMITNPRDLKQFIKILRKTPPSIFVGLNTLFNGLLNRPEFLQLDFSSLKLTVSGGMSTQRYVAEQWQKVTGTPIIEGYGLTESSPVISINPVNLKNFNGSAGLPVPSTDVCVRDENGNKLPLGEEGELWVKGPQVMQGYWNKPEETANVFDDEGWLRTGDIVRLDENGFIYIVDRMKDMILVSGFNVYPNEIESIIMEHQGVKEVAVIGVPSDRTGEMIKAYIVKQDPNLTEQDIIQYCRQNLTAYKVPKLIEFREELPKSNVGKVLRRHLREQHSYLQKESIAT